MAQSDKHRSSAHDPSPGIEPYIGPSLCPPPPLLALSNLKTLRQQNKNYKLLYNYLDNSTCSSKCGFCFLWSLPWVCKNLKFLSWRHRKFPSACSHPFLLISMPMLISASDLSFILPLHCKFIICCYRYYFSWELPTPSLSPLWLSNPEVSLLNP